MNGWKAIAIIGLAFAATAAIGIAVYCVANGPNVIRLDFLFHSGPPAPTASLTPTATATAQVRGAVVPLGQTAYPLPMATATRFPQAAPTCFMVNGRVQNLPCVPGGTPGVYPGPVSPAATPTGQPPYVQPPVPAVQPTGYPNP